MDEDENLRPWEENNKDYFNIERKKSIQIDNLFFLGKH